MLRALRQLRAEGLLEFRRGRGVTVLRRPDPAAQLREQLSELVEQAGRLGYGPEEVIEWIKRDAGLPRETEQP